METEDEYVREIPMDTAEKLLNSCQRDYDQMADMLIVKGNQLVICKNKRNLSPNFENIPSRNREMFPKPHPHVKRLRLKQTFGSSLKKRLNNKTFRFHKKAYRYSTLHKC